MKLALCPLFCIRLIKISTYLAFFLPLCVFLFYSLVHTCCQ